MTRILKLLLLFIMTTASHAADQALPFSPNHYGHTATYIVNPDNVVAIFDNTRRILHPDLPTFHVLTVGEGTLASDKNRVYYKGIPVNAAAGHITTAGYTPEYPSTWLWKDGKHVWFGSRILKDADPTSFNTVKYGNSNWYRDKNAVWFRDRRMENIDPTSFTIATVIAYDKRQVYNEDGTVMIRDGQPVEPVNHVLYKTAKAVYYANRSIGHMRGTPVESADPATIRPLTRRIAIDKNHIWCDDRPAPIDAANFPNVHAWEQGNIPYLTDGKRIYHCTKPVGWLDTASFGMVAGNGWIYDKTGIYEGAFNQTPLPFAYDEPPTPANTATGGGLYYMLYKNQAYDLVEKRLYTGLDAITVATLRDSRIRLQLVKSPDGSLKAVPRAEETVDFYQFTIKNGHLSYQGKPVASPSVDVATFAFLAHPYYRDKNRIYLWTADASGHRLMPLEGIAPAHARVYDHHFITDGQHLFFLHHKIDGIKGDILELAAIFPGYRPIRNVPRGMHVDPAEQGIYYVFRTTRGYWLIDTQNMEAPVVQAIANPWLKDTAN